MLHRLVLFALPLDRLSPPLARLVLLSRLTPASLHPLPRQQQQMAPTRPLVAFHLPLRVALVSLPRLPLLEAMLQPLPLLEALLQPLQLLHHPDPCFFPLILQHRWHRAGESVVVASLPLLVVEARLPLQRWAEGE